MSDRELAALDLALTAWRMACDRRGYFQLPGQYSLAAFRHEAQLPEYGPAVAGSVYHLDEFLRVWNRGGA